MSILVVEPNLALQDLLSQQFKPILIGCVQNAAAALEVMQTLRFHLLIIEPFHDGVDWILALPYKVPVLVLSSLPTERGVVLARQIGASYMQKPYVGTCLLKVVTMLLEQSGRVRDGQLVLA